MSNIKLTYTAHSLTASFDVNEIKHLFQHFGHPLFQMSHAASTALCRSIKIQCELYPSRDTALCLDPYSGLGFALWCLSRLVICQLGVGLEENWGLIVVRLLFNIKID